MSSSIPLTSAFPSAPVLAQDPVSGEDILAMWNWPGYGSYPKNPPVLVDGLDHALVYNFAGQ